MCKTIKIMRILAAAGVLALGIHLLWINRYAARLPTGGEGVV